jgi:hypothetical protein
MNLDHRMSLPDFTTSNLRLLAAKDPALADRLTGLPATASFAVEQTPAGVPTVIASLPAMDPYPLHSRIDPLHEAHLWADLHPLHDGPLVILGLGLAYPAMELIRRRPRRRIVLVEADPSILQLALSRVDLSILLSPEAVTIHLPEDTDEFHDVLDTLPGDLRYGLYIPAMALHPGRYERLREILDAEIAHRREVAEPDVCTALDLLLKELVA